MTLKRRKTFSFLSPQIHDDKGRSWCVPEEEEEEDPDKWTAPDNAVVPLLVVSAASAASSSGSKVSPPLPFANR